MAHGTAGDGDEIIAGINVTPLVDIVLVILIIFIVTASFVLRQSIPVELPRAQTSEQAGASPLLLALTAEGVLYINGRQSALDELEAAVKLARDRAAESRRPLSAFVSADIRTTYGQFAALIDRLRLLGVADIALDTQPEALASATGAEVR